MEPTAPNGGASTDFDMANQVARVTRFRRFLHQIWFKFYQIWLTKSLNPVPFFQPGRPGRQYGPGGGQRHGRPAHVGHYGRHGCRRPTATADEQSRSQESQAGHEQKYLRYTNMLTFSRKTWFSSSPLVPGSNGGGGPNPPSRVIHIRNIPPDVTEAEIIHLGIPFGRVTNVLVLKGKNQVGTQKWQNVFEKCKPPFVAGLPRNGGRTLGVRHGQLLYELRRPTPGALRLRPILQSQRT